MQYGQYKGSVFVFKAKIKAVATVCCSENKSAILIYLFFHS